MAKIKIDWKATTIVGGFWPFAAVAFAYGAACVVDQLNGQILALPVMVAVHLVFSFVWLMADPVPTKTAFCRFLNEAAMGILCGWVLLLAYVFTIGLFTLNAEKSFGVAFGAGVGILIVCTPCAIVSAICTSSLMAAGRGRPS